MDDVNVSTKEYKTPIYMRKCSNKYRKENSAKIKENHSAKIAELKESGVYDAFKAERAAYMKEYRSRKKKRTRNSKTKFIIFFLCVLFLKKSF